MTQDNLPTVIAQNEIELAPGLIVTVMVLDNGQRVLPAADVRRACEWLGVTLPDDGERADAGV
ncbi:hypothetical protein [Erwinia sp. Leaf53]|uniref:hypothetical protein n=1 Tax=Erwinia sp. Leaf53 TaxID=1736225 RepID=UPI0006F7DE8E|nr:hypothetical protein [Erwinia sp. Leaf53]KQN63649.1 hypothetical protein ASF13_18915 [Erwinia sp. Leaf53]